MISKHTWRLIWCLLCCLAVRCVNCSGILNSSLTQTQESHTWPQTDFNPQFSNLSEVLLIFICLTRQWARVEEDREEKVHNKERKCEKQDSGKERHENYHSREEEIGDLKKNRLHTIWHWAFSQRIQGRKPHAPKPFFHSFPPCFFTIWVSNLQLLLEFYKNCKVCEIFYRWNQ